MYSECVNVFIECFHRKKANPHDSKFISIYLQKNTCAQIHRILHSEDANVFY